MLIVWKWFDYGLIWKRFVENVELSVFEEIVIFCNLEDLFVFKVLV